MAESVWLQIYQVVQDEILRMWWFFLLSILLVGLIKGYKLDLRIRTSINRAGFWAIPLAVVIGMVSPLCACGILPVVISLAMLGTPLAPLIAMLTTSPVMGPDALLLTYQGLGGDWALLKVLGAAVLGFTSGVLVLWLQKLGYLANEMLRLQPVYQRDGTLAPVAEIGAAHGIKVKRMQVVPRDSRLRFILDRTLDAGLFIGKFLLLAILLEALIVTLVPVSWIGFLVGQQNLQSLLVAALAGLPLPTNQIPIIPILAGLLERGIDHGAAWTLLLAGPVTSLPAIFALWGMFQKRLVLVFIGNALVVSVALGGILQLMG